MVSLFDRLRALLNRAVRRYKYGPRIDAGGLDKSLSEVLQGHEVYEMDVKVVHINENNEGDNPVEVRNSRNREGVESVEFVEDSIDELSPVSLDLDNYECGYEVRKKNNKLFVAMQAVSRWPPDVFLIFFNGRIL